MDFDQIHGWLSQTYWSPGIERDRVIRGAQHSTLVLGAFDGKDQIAYARVVSDTTRFAYLADVFVIESHRGQGIAQALVQYALKHSLLQDVSSWYLRTLDAHGVYEKLGFKPISDPERWMSWKKG